MNELHSDALVFFGATGDLAFKKIFPALQALVKRGRLNVPVIGVARSAENLEELRSRARSSPETCAGSARASHPHSVANQRRVCELPEPHHASFFQVVHMHE